MADTEQKTEETPVATEEVKKVTESPAKPVENGEEKAVEETAAATTDGDKLKPSEETNGDDKAEEEGAETKENGTDEKEDASPEAEDAPAPSHEAPTENPFSDEDVQQLLDLESGEEGWEKVKEKKGVTVYRLKAEKNATPVIKGVIEYTGIPSEKILEFYTDFELRNKWNKKTCLIDVLEERDDFKIIHSVYKMTAGCDMRDAVQCTMVRSEEEPVRHVLLYKTCNHPNKPAKKSFPMRADVQLMGAVIRPKEGEEGVTTVTFLSQVNLKGWMPKVFVNKTSIGFQLALYDDLMMYWKKITEPPKSPEKKEKKSKDAAKSSDDKKDESAATNGETETKEDDKKDGTEDKEAAEEGADVKTEEKKEDESAAATEGDKPADAVEGAAAEGGPVGEGDGGKLDTSDIPAADEDEAAK